MTAIWESGCPRCELCRSSEIFRGSRHNFLLALAASKKEGLKRLVMSYVETSIGVSYN